MKILLAGYNIDYDLICELKDKCAFDEDITPETLSAAYARISRSPKFVDELRQIARGEVEKARKSNRNIVFEMGHSSVAEHAVFNVDIIGVSRLLVEAIEKFR
ncbi:MAG: FAD-dependent thymidylate synthase, partial [Smithellaceae bacterium]